MQRALRPWVTAGVALAGTSIIAVTPVAAPPLDVRERSVQLLSTGALGDVTGFFDGALSSIGAPLAGMFAGVNPGPYPVVGAGELAANTAANLAGLQRILDSISLPGLNPADLNPSNLVPDLNALVTDLHEAGALLNPASLAAIDVLLILGVLDGPNAALNGLAGIVENITGALIAGNDKAVLENVVLAPTTIVNDFINGYPATIDAAGDYVLNRPFDDLLSPEIGLLTNPDSTTTPLATGTIDSLVMVGKVLAEAVSAATGQGVMTGSLPEVGSGVGSTSLQVTVDVSQILQALGITIPSDISYTVPSFSLTDYQVVNIPVDDLGLPDISYTLPAGSYGGETVDIPLDSNLPSDISATIPSISVPAETISIAVSSLDLPTEVNYTLPTESKCLFGECISVGGNTIEINTDLPSTVSYTVPSFTLSNQTVDIPLSDLDLPTSINYTVPEGSYGGETVDIPLSSYLPSDISFTIPSITVPSETLNIPIPSDLIPSIETLTPTIDLIGSPVPDYVYSLATDLTTTLTASLAPLTQQLPDLLAGTASPTFDIGPLLADALAPLGLTSLVPAIAGSLPIDLTNVLAEALNGVF